jgi:hypothetical protein
MEQTTGLASGRIGYHRRITGINTVTESVALPPFSKKGGAFAAPEKALQFPISGVVAWTVGRGYCYIPCRLVLPGLEHLEQVIQFLILNA